jgi:hypothetical protein
MPLHCNYISQGRYTGDCDTCLVFNEIETGRLRPELKSNLDTFLGFSSK